jgi:hypothetical protein
VIGIPYYNRIRTGINKLRSTSYAVSLSDLVHFDIRSYYKKGSNENRDAVELEHLLTKAITAVQNGDDVSSALGTR